MYNNYTMLHIQLHCRTYIVIPCYIHSYIICSYNYTMLHLQLHLQFHCLQLQLYCVTHSYIYNDIIYSYTVTPTVTPSAVTPCYPYSYTMLHLQLHHVRLNHVTCTVTPSTVILCYICSYIVLHMQLHQAAMATCCTALWREAQRPLMTRWNISGRMTWHQVKSSHQLLRRTSVPGRTSFINHLTGITSFSSEHRLIKLTLSHI